MKLKDAVVEIAASDNQWAVYAESLDPNAEARLRQTRFENGEDDKKFIIDGEMATMALMSYTDGDPCWIDEHGDREEFAQWLVDESWIE